MAHKDKDRYIIFDRKGQEYSIFHSVSENAARQKAKKVAKERGWDCYVNLHPMYEAGEYFGFRKADDKDGHLVIREDTESQMLTTQNVLTGKKEEFSFFDIYYENATRKISHGFCEGRYWALKEKKAVQVIGFCHTPQQEVFAVIERGNTSEVRDTLPVKHLTIMSGDRPVIVWQFLFDDSALNICPHPIAKVVRTTVPGRIPEGFRYYFHNPVTIGWNQRYEYVEKSSEPTYYTRCEQLDKLNWLSKNEFCLFTKSFEKGKEIALCALSEAVENLQEKIKEKEKELRLLRSRHRNYLQASDCLQKAPAKYPTT